MHKFITPTILEAIVKYSQQAPLDGLVCMAQGNVSARDPQTGYIAITPHEFPYQEMSAKDLVVVDIQGNPIMGQHSPSFETPVHCAVYQARPEVMAVVHTEPTYVNALGAVRQEIPPLTTTMLKASGGTIPVMPFQRSGSEAFARQMLDLMGDRYAVVWANHGLLVVGPTVEIAYGRSLAIEQGAHSLLLALQLGKPKTLAEFDEGISLEE